MSFKNGETRVIQHSSKVRQLIHMFEQLTTCGGQVTAPTAVRTENVVTTMTGQVKKPVKKVPKALTLLINGRRVARTITYRENKSEQVMEVE